MNTREHLITKFYTAFQQRNWRTMQTCYHEEVLFNDPAFTNLKGKQAKAMWHMLAENAKDFSLVFSQVVATETEGSCHWEATYSFSRTGRKVVNKIDANFQFKDGLIYRHTDRFDFWKWTRMALGTSGILLGWTPFLQNKVKATAMGGLKKFIESRAEYKD
ncbi:MAG: nuclear transport factor 2 family protein [Chryseotalea sp. WA131a]|jgi:ketosteroid isomerase-like protein|nr:MAG: nuclear transport factor 2 family protein [Chryseotalea sp. WA131a]